MTQTITHKYLRNLIDNLSEENFDDFLVELQFSTLILPVNEEDGVASIRFNDELYIPLFTDMYEFNKFRGRDRYDVLNMEFSVYLATIDTERIPGFVINPDSERFPVTEEILNLMEPNFIFDQDYQLFTTTEIRKIKNSIDNRELNEFIGDESNRWDFETLMEKLNRSTLLTLLMSHKDYSENAEGGVIFKTEKIPKCLYGIWDRNYALLFSREPTNDTIPDDTVFKYTEIVNFPLMIREVLNHDLDGFILNVDGENITIDREHLRNFMRNFSCPNLDDYGMYAFTIEEGE